MTSLVTKTQVGVQVSVDGNNRCRKPKFES